MTFIIYLSLPLSSPSLWISVTCYVTLPSEMRGGGCYFQWGMACASFCSHLLFHPSFLLTQIGLSQVRGVIRCGTMEDIVHHSSFGGRNERSLHYLDVIEGIRTGHTIIICERGTAPSTSGFSLFSLFLRGIIKFSFFLLSFIPFFLSAKKGPFGHV